MDVPFPLLSPEKILLQIKKPKGILISGKTPECLKMTVSMGLFVAHVDFFFFTRSFCPLLVLDDLMNDTIDSCDLILTI